MDIEDILRANLAPHLPDRFQEGQPLDVTNGPPNLDDHHLRPALPAETLNPVFDQVGDMGNDLDRAPQEVTPAFLSDDRLINLAGGDIVQPAQLLVHKPLVVAQVQVGFSAVGQDVTLAMLQGRHRAGVHVEVGIKLLHRDADPPALEQPPQRGGRNSLSHRTDHATGDEDILGHHSPPVAESNSLFSRRSVNRLLAMVHCSPLTDHLIWDFEQFWSRAFPLQGTGRRAISCGHDRLKPLLLYFPAF